MTKDSTFVMRVLTATTLGENCDSIWWRTDGEYAPITFFVNCNDEFYWGCADCEEITPENIDVFEQAMAACREATSARRERGNAIYAPMLFCARVRKMRPQGAVYPSGEDYVGVCALLDACGPEREVGRGNPRARGVERAEKEWTPDCLPPMFPPVGVSG